MNASSQLISLILRRGDADKMEFKRLRSLGLCMSYFLTLQNQLALGVGHDSPVFDWLDENVASKDKEAGVEDTEITAQVQSAEPPEEKTPSTGADVLYQPSISEEPFVIISSVKVSRSSLEQPTVPASELSQMVMPVQAIPHCSDTENSPHVVQPTSKNFKDMLRKFLIDKMSKVCKSSYLVKAKSNTEVDKESNILTYDTAEDIEMHISSANSQNKKGDELVKVKYNHEVQSKIMCNVTTNYQNLSEQLKSPVTDAYKEKELTEYLEQSHSIIDSDTSGILEIPNDASEVISEEVM